MIDVKEKLLNAIGESTCFGVAYDENIPECKECDVKAQCRSKAEGAVVPTPVAKSPVTPPPTITEPPTKKEKDKKPKPPADKSSTDKPPTPSKTSKTTKEDKATDGNLPDFKSMTLQELVAMANQNGVVWKDYNHENITRMRLIMGLKKHFTEQASK